MSISMTRNTKIFLALAALYAIFVWQWTLHNGFVMWDDDFNLYNNQLLKEGQWKRFWTADYMGFYIPMTYTIWTFLGGIFGLDSPLPFHTLNFIFHFVNTYLVFRWLSCLLIMTEDKAYLKSELKFWAPLLGAAVYMFHPLQVGAVAWNSGFRDLISHFWIFLTLLLIFERPNEKGLILAMITFFFSLISKPSSVYLSAFVFALCFLIPRAPRKKGYLFAGFALIMGLVFAYVTTAIQSHFMVGLPPPRYVDRPLIIWDTYSFYTWKFLLPIKLSADYGRTPERLLEWQMYRDIWFWLPLFLIPVVTFYWKRWRALLIFGALWVIPIIPISGLVQFNYMRIATVADHYFIPSLPAMGFLLANILIRYPKIWVKAAFVVLIVVWGGLTSVRIPAWKDSESLFYSMLEVTPFSHSANNYLGYFAFEKRDWPKAEGFFRNALASQPNSGIASGNLAYSLLKLNRFPEVVALLENRVKDPAFLEANEVHRHVIAVNFLGLGLGLANVQRFQDAFNTLCQVFQYGPQQRDMVDASATLERLRVQLNPKEPKSVQCPPGIPMAPR